MICFSPSLPSKAWKRYDSLDHFTKIVDRPKRSYPTGTYINHHLSILLDWWICRNCLGSIWAFNTPRSRRHKDCRATLSQGKIITSEMCDTPLRWYIGQPREGKLHRRTRTAVDISNLPACIVVSYWQHWHTKLERCSAQRIKNIRGLQFVLDP